MKNKTKLIVANLFALVAVVGILTLFRSAGIEIGSASGAMVPNVLLLLIPQAGFIYFYWKSFSNENRKAIA
ncbi:hypothetical protein SAMN00777080_3235 [Aquiflexum balticum DSM 16537]|uniref:Uncharacterized protein n=1 Tax=Aquiflexum balticum DSM 16537 TaxID=758820 RepID=A0A1W2H6U6_9BACT|nr:hypothetical protein [Aquiflexum balticum]SMD44611.1 hypothetical protein SAMN00777080_3235 [Aquiflexum balticum DSM 16537]